MIAHFASCFTTRVDYIKCKFFPNCLKKVDLEDSFQDQDKGLLTVIHNIWSVMCILYFDPRAETISIKRNFPDV